MRKRQNPTQTHLTICSDTGRWNLEGKSSLGFTVKHWISEFRGLRSEKGISVTLSKQLNRNTHTQKRTKNQNWCVTPVRAQVQQAGHKCLTWGAGCTGCTGCTAQGYTGQRRFWCHLQGVTLSSSSRRWGTASAAAPRSPRAARTPCPGKWTLCSANRGTHSWHQLPQGKNQCSQYRTGCQKRWHHRC